MQIRLVLTKKDQFEAFLVEKMGFVKNMVIFFGLFEPIFFI
jgi:hypothetical protein